MEKLFTERSMALQAWGTYGILWPVVHYQLGVSPDLGRRRVSVVPQVPNGQRRVAGSHIRLGAGSLAVTASRAGRVLRTVVRQDKRWHLTIGAIVPAGKRVTKVRLDGHRVKFRVVPTARGREVLVNGGAGRGASRLVVRVR
jgi:hypothetical protein